MKHPIFENMKRQMEPDSALLARTKAAVLQEKQKKRFPSAVRYGAAAAACLAVISAAVWAYPLLNANHPASLSVAYGTGGDLAFAGILTDEDGAGYEASLSGAMGILPGGCVILEGIGGELAEAMNDPKNDGGGFAVAMKPANLYSLYQEEMDSFTYEGKTVGEWEQLASELRAALKTDTASDLETAVAESVTEVSSEEASPEQNAAGAVSAPLQALAPDSSGSSVSQTEDLEQRYNDTSANLDAALNAQTQAGLALLQEELAKKGIETEIENDHLTGILTREQIEAVDEINGVYIGLAPQGFSVSLAAVWDDAVSYVSSCVSAASGEPDYAGGGAFPASSGSGVTACPAEAPEGPFTREDAVKAAQSLVENTEDILNYDDPEAETVTLPESHPVYDSIKEISRDIGGKTVWRVVFHTEQDGLLGPVTVYLDTESGRFYGFDYRY